MVRPDFPSIRFSSEDLSGLIGRLAETREIWQSGLDVDGLCRLRPGFSPRFSEPATCLPVIPLKKLLLPDGDLLWQKSAAGYLSPLPPPQVLLLGVALCDLQALACLDQTFAGDASYRERRQRLLAVGGPCRPGADCACSAEGWPPGGDLFADGERLWALSRQGEVIVEEVARGATPEGSPLPWPEVPVTMQAISAAQFADSSGDPCWESAAQPCLACGACSAVCPTCLCYEVIDERDDHAIRRRRRWDNCFFAEHARVAGGHDFRPDRAQRLRFRFEHKRIGFGEQRGHSSCVGCGRCRKACPVGIDLESLACLLAGNQK